MYDAHFVLPRLADLLQCMCTCRQARSELLALKQEEALQEEAQRVREQAKHAAAPPEEESQDVFL